jgi:hypothetical protein
MRQLREWGWMHHLARHSVACFLTRGDLYLSWEAGKDVFEELLLDADHFLNAANWMWLSATAFFNQVRVLCVSLVVLGRGWWLQGERWCWEGGCRPAHAFAHTSAVLLSRRTNPTTPLGKLLPPPPPPHTHTTNHTHTPHTHHTRTHHTHHTHIHTL